MRRLVTFVVLVFADGAGCGFGLADDTGKPIPGQHWPWVCADGGAAGDAGCPASDAGAEPDADGAPGD
jgi:hypothetical protein